MISAAGREKKEEWYQFIGSILLGTVYRYGIPGICSVTKKMMFNTNQDQLVKL